MIVCPNIIKSKNMRSKPNRVDEPQAPQVPSWLYKTGPYSRAPEKGSAVYSEWPTVKYPANAETILYL